MKVRRVLLILEEFDALRGQFGQHFATRGYDIFSASTLHDALTIVDEESPQTIIVDYRLRGTLSTHVVEALRAAMPGSYVLLIGGPGTTVSFERLKQAGASRVVTSPIDPKAIGEIVEEAYS